MVIECVLLTASLCHTVRDKPVVTLAALGLSASIADIHQTERLLHDGHQFQEYNPLSHPFVSHPAIEYGAAITATLLSAALGHRMRQSRNRVIRHMWWLPSAIQGSLGLAGYLYTRSRS